MSKGLCLALAFLVGIVPAQTRIRITETAGIARENEPVTVTAAGRTRTIYVSVAPKESKVVPLDTTPPEDALHFTPAGRLGFVVENGQLIADLSRRAVRGHTEDSGTLRQLVYKPFGVTLLRTFNRMHWAPSFQRTGARGYTSIADWDPVQDFDLRRVEGSVVFTRRGHHADYPEIGLNATYTFYAHVPYFLFRSVMTIEKPIDMYWLRNQEMTMDGFFTHVAWPGPAGAPRIAAFDEHKPILDKEPIPVDVPWVAFVNLERGYGFGAVVLDYQATTTAGATTSINDGAHNGKYWDRHLINRTSTPLRPGDRYEERTAYVLFRAAKDAPVAEFLDWERRLRNPLRVEVLGER